MRPFIVAVDFDDTCVNHSFPDVGREIPYAVQVLRRFSNAGMMIILNTCRENDREGRQYLQEAIDWFSENRIPLAAANETPPEVDFRSGTDVYRKVYADIYLDDAAAGCPRTPEGFVDWLLFERIVFAQAHREGHPNVNAESGAPKDE